MTDVFQRQIFSATDLTRAGRLQEAATLLQTALRGLTTPAAESGHPGSGPEAAPQIRPFAAREPLARLMHGIRAATGEGLARSSRGDRPIGESGPGTFLLAGFSNEAGSRPYKLYVPSRYTGEPVPLVVMLHGCTQSPDDFAAGTRMNTIAEEWNCLVCYPAQTATANASKCWNWFNSAEQRRDRGEPSLIAGITQQVMRDYAVDRRRVYVAGLSAGGALAATMGELYPDLYAAIGVHSGLACGSASDVGSAFAAMRGGGHGPARGGRASDARRRGAVPAIVFHGDSDNTVHPSNGDGVIAQARNSAALRTTVEQATVPGGRSYRRTLHHDDGGSTVLEQWSVHGAGHAWSGGSASGSYTDERGPDASREMLRFFMEHPRRDDFEPSIKV